MADNRSARAVVDSVCDSFADLPAPPDEPSTVDGPIGWPGYDAAHAGAAERTGERESVLCGTATFGGVRAVVIAFEFGFLGGSIGGRTGALLESGFGYARQNRLPVVSLVATGGSRMQEGMRALTQLQRVARQLALHRSAGLAHVSVLRDPSTGGGWATLGAGADVTLALPGAQVGFAGSRVRPPGDDLAYTAESQRDTGQVDEVVDGADLAAALLRWLRVLAGPRLDEAPLPEALGGTEPAQTGWEAVLAARAPARPRADSYVDAYVSGRVVISGDRCGGVDPGVLCGFGVRDGGAVAFAAQRGTATEPAGFRTLARLVRLADRLGIPVLTIVDTPGAANDGAAERAGAGAAIAGLFEVIASAAVPVTTLVIGEGGSGGALALATPGRTWVTPDGYFTVTSPEAAAAILKRETDEVPAIADRLRLRPADLLELGVVNGIVGGPR
ncbi:acetyl-CoA carboxylase [Amycolatopsis antarctica]|uniref:Acetyl-coenzyme A carboxylase carboxyl transferase subunits beta/alpha n=1 Tax=Amycolatopsis antarctica TaxID=1854586 RepID=A0A263DAB4_9PSEU|nr:carboxyl transferase domain-containing protein [Amycolatopsis antarctica]OZM74928.1 acetyl-CoA carboxylase [Amycolatopsis antarctica]